MREFSIGERDFKLNKIDAFKQFHVVRRLAPILSDLIPMLSQIQKTMKTEQSEEAKFEEMSKILSPILTGLSKLSDEDSDKVLRSLLSAVEMKQNPGWARIANDQMIMFSDLELPLLLQLAGRSFMFNMQGFFSILPQALPGKG